jgi:hypothetical protein
MSRSKKKILDALKTIGHEPRDVHWEPVGVCFEMQGRSGGWFVDDEPVGLNADQAVATIKEFPHWFTGEVRGN